MRVLVTGAAGYLGRHVVAALLRRGHAVRALDKGLAPLGELSPPGVERIEADLCTSPALAEACRGADAAIHLAAQMSGSDESVVRTAAVGTERLLQAMERAGVRRLVLASSLSVYDWGGPGDTLAEGSALEARPESRDGYTTAKLRQEQLAREACRRSGTALAVIRPGAIWGRGREYPSIIGQRAGPLHFLVAAGRQLPVVHVENCADAFAAVAEAPGLEGTFNLLDHPDLTVGRFVADHLRRSGRFGLAIPVAYRAGLAAVRLIHALSPPALRRRLPSFVGPARFAARYRPLRVEAGLLRRASGWSPPLDYAQCLERTYGGPAAGAPAGGRPGLASP